MSNILKDITTLTDVPENTLKKFIPIINACIGHSVHEGICMQTESIEIDLEIGKLCIRVDSVGIKYKFVPSKELEKLLVTTVTTNTSPILATLECNLQQKIERAYKELL